VIRPLLDPAGHAGAFTPNVLCDKSVLSGARLHQRRTSL